LLRDGGDSFTFLGNLEAAANGATYEMGGRLFAAGLGAVYSRMLSGGQSGRTTAELAVEPLASKVDEVHGVLHPIAKKQRTTAVLRTDGPDIVAVGKRDISPTQRTKVKGPMELEARASGVDAEVTALTFALREGWIPRLLAASRPICPNCRAVIEASGGKVLMDGKSAWWPGHYMQ
jgi:hypothetical protein